MSDNKISGSGHERIILDSWKEISTFLERSEKTCRKWEKKFNLPIHRLDDSPKARVFAYSDELKKWRDNHLHQINVRNVKRDTRRKLHLIFLTGSILFVMIFIAIYFVFFKTGAQVSLRPGSESISLGVLYFENLTGDKSMDIWRTAIADLITTDLLQSRYVRVLRPEEIFSILEELDLAKTKKYSKEDFDSIAAKGKINHLLRGSFVQTGEHLILSLTLCNTDSGKTLHSFSVKIRGLDNLFESVDKITKEIKKGLFITPEEIALDDDKRVGEITTSSPEAYLKTIKGNQFMYQADYREAISYYRQALKQDPDLAMAHYSLGNAYWLTGKRIKAVKSHTRALQLSENLSGWEHYTIKRTSNYFIGEQNWPEAFKSGFKLLEFYPNDFLCNITLGLLNIRSGKFKDGQKFFEFLILNREETAYPYLLLAISFQLQGKYNEADEVLKKYLNQFPENSMMRSYLIGNLILDGEAETGLAELEKNFFQLERKFHPYLNVSTTRGDIFMYLGKLKAAARIYSTVIYSDKYLAHSITARIKLGRLKIMEGNYSKALLQLHTAAEQLKGIEDMGILAAVVSLNLSYVYRRLRQFPESVRFAESAWRGATESQDWELEVHAIHNLCMVLLSVSDNSLLKVQMEKLKQFISKGMNKKRIRFYTHLKGLIEMKSKKLSEAVKLLERSVSETPFEYDTRCLYLSFYQNQALFLDSLAQAYEGSGFIDKAKSVYERIISLTFGRNNSSDLFSRAHYHLGRIFLKLNKKKKALHCFRNFIDLWKDCDPEFQYMVEDARKRIKASQEN